MSYKMKPTWCLALPQPTAARNPSIPSRLHSVELGLRHLADLNQILAANDVANPSANALWSRLGRYTPVLVWNYKEKYRN